MRGVASLPSETSHVRTVLRSRRRRIGPAACRMTLPTSSLATSSVVISSSRSPQAANCLRMCSRAWPAAAGSSGRSQAAMSSSGSRGLRLGVSPVGRRIVLIRALWMGRSW